MKYRKVKKAYCKKYFHIVRITFRNKKTGRINYKISKMESGNFMQKCLKHNKNGISVLLESIDEQGKME